MLSKPHGAMHGNHAGSEIEDFHGAEASGLEHTLQDRLVRMHADRFCEVAIRLARTDDSLAEPRQHPERGEGVERLWGVPDVRELQPTRRPPGFSTRAISASACSLCVM